MCDLDATTPVDELTDQERAQFFIELGKSYEALQADAKAWAADQAERAVWERLAGETLAAEIWTEDDFAADK